MIEVLKLPSNFLYYPTGAKVSYRPFSVKDVLTFSDIVTTVAMIKYQLDGISADFPVEELTFADFVYLCVLRKYTANDELELLVDTKCSACNEETQVRILCNDIVFKNIEEVVPPLVINGDTYAIAPPTVGKIIKCIEENSQINTFLLSLYSFENINAANELFNTTNKDDIKKITTAVDKLTHYVKPVVRQCINCKEDIIIDMRIKDFFFS